MSLLKHGLQRRADRALVRQLEYQRRKAEKLRGHEAEIIAEMKRRSDRVRQRIENLHPIPADARVLEVGSGAHGLVFFFGADVSVGVDPLAEHYAELFPAWQRRASTVAALGEALPFADASFDVVLCDNVVDHAENPRKIVEEIARVLKPGGSLYFEVNFHHAFYGLAAAVHAGWRALGIRFEVGPFADHTVHLTRAGAQGLFAGLPFRLAEVTDNATQTRRAAAATPSRHPGDWLKRLFFKNARFEVIAIRTEG